MNEFTTNASMNTPYINGSLINGTIKMKGTFCLDDGEKFFKPFKDWIKIFCTTQRMELKITLEFEKLSTACSLVLLHSMKEIKKLAESKTVRFIWKYRVGDDQMKEMGEDFRVILGDVLELREKVKLAS
ncbi:MAG: DUF1987 family protein [Crocinitomicaceae bacterium]|nr:DUF1987 family protein [Crocinitomicaceae bacterium]